MVGHDHNSQQKKVLQALAQIEIIGCEHVNSVEFELNIGWLVANTCWPKTSKVLELRRLYNVAEPSASKLSNDDYEKVKRVCHMLHTSVICMDPKSIHVRIT
jgi:hypothetical protein